MRVGSLVFYAVPTADWCVFIAAEKDVWSPNMVTVRDLMLAGF